MYFKRVNKLEISNVNKLNNTKQHLKQGVRLFTLCTRVAFALHITFFSSYSTLSLICHSEMESQLMRWYIKKS